MWPSTGRAKSGKRLETAAFKAWDKISPRNAGKRKKIELCAARLFGARGPDGRNSIKVNLEYEKLVSNDWNHFLRIFYGEFDSGSERTLAACLRHASRTESFV